MKVDIALNNCINNSYSVTIDSLPKLSFDTKVVVVTNTTVAALHLEYLLERLEAESIDVIELEDGEEFKRLETIEKILNFCFEKRLDRKSLLIAFGGGVIGDMTGFAASIYQRGIDFIQVPTTLLSQVDASVGGKTGINNSYGKNLIGAFYQPKAVYIDTYFLSTLPAREFGAGVAEIIKMAVMFDRAFFEYLQSHTLDVEAHLKEAIATCVALKADVVAKDEKESGIRAVLNYGHTFGHVVENLTGYKQYLHGEAVAIGMVMANSLAQKLELLSADEAKEVEGLLKTYNLPTAFDIKDYEDFYEHFFLDKKSAKGKISFILPQGIGGHCIRNDIDKSIVLEALRG